ncbi:MAG: glycosyltransferase family 117 protein [Gemmatimonadales bacterium]
MTQSAAPGRERPPYRWAAITAAVVFAIYVLTLAPTTAFWDTSEYIAAAKVLGIPHPPGNPLFVLLAHVWGLLPLAEAYAVRINLFAAMTSAAAAGLWFLVADRWLREIAPVRWVRIGSAFAGVLVGATMWTVWNQSTVNEKVYTVSLLSIALCMWLVVHWGDEEPGPHRDRWLVLIAYVMALSSTNHMMAFLAVPALAVYVLWTDWRAAVQPWAILLGVALVLAVTGSWTEIGFDSAKGIVLLLVVLGSIGYALWRSPRNPLVWLGVVAVVVGISLNYVYLPMRAAQLPPINEGEPIGWQALQDVLNRVQYGKPSLDDRQAPFGAQLANFFQYFSWQFARDWGAAARTVTTIGFGAIGLVGLWQLGRRDHRAGLAAAALLGVLTVALVYYMNFKYGYSWCQEDPALACEVRERDYFFMGSFSAFGVFVALGLGALMQLVANLFRERLGPRAWVVASPILALALIPLFGNRVTASRAGERLARDFAVDILQSVEPYGILITAGDNDTFPLWYAQEVEGVRRDVTLANLSLMNTRWHLRQLRRRETPGFDPSRAAELWHTDGDEWTRPTDPVFSLDLAELDSLPEVMQVPEKGGGIQVDSIAMVFGQEYLLLQDLATIFLIRDNAGKRPIFFSWSDGGYPDQTLGLSPYLVSQGLVRKLMPTPVEPNDSIVLSSGLGYFDLPRSRALLWDTYHWRSATRERPRGWVDAPSSSILQLYAIVYGGAAEVLRKAGDRVAAARADSIAREVSENIRR